MLSIDWRSPSAYGFAENIPAAGFAWEYLRRNEDYRRDFQAIAALREPYPERLEVFTQRWGLRFPDRSRHLIRPAIPVLASKRSAAGRDAVASRT